MIEIARSKVLGESRYEMRFFNRGARRREKTDLVGIGSLQRRGRFLQNGQGRVRAPGFQARPGGAWKIGKLRDLLLRDMTRLSKTLDVFGEVGRRII